MGCRGLSREESSSVKTHFAFVLPERFCYFFFIFPPFFLLPLIFLGDAPPLKFLLSSPLCPFKSKQLRNTVARYCVEFMVFIPIKDLKGFYKRSFLHVPPKGQSKRVTLEVHYILEDLPPTKSEVLLMTLYPCERLPMK